MPVIPSSELKVRKMAERTSGLALCKTRLMRRRMDEFSDGYSAQNEQIIEYQVLSSTKYEKSLFLWQMSVR